MVGKIRQQPKRTAEVAAAKTFTAVFIEFRGKVSKMGVKQKNGAVGMVPFMISNCFRV